MPLRYNARELVILANKASRCFDKEGVLLMKDKQDGLFRKGEAYVQRLFRLRGNLLFYFKTCEPSSEVLGVFVLERCMVELDMDDDNVFSFGVMFEGEERPLKLAATTENGRAGWIESMHIASYECMKMQLQSLREQLRHCTGRDPLVEAAADRTGPGTADSGEPVLELAVSCEQLPVDASGRPPDTFVAIHYATPQKQHWFPLAHTEVIERCTAPTFLTTAALYTDLPSGTRIKLVVYSVRERMTGTMAQLGTATLPLNDLLTKKIQHLPLEAVEMQKVGYVVVRAWHTESSNSKRLDIMKCFYDNMHTKTYLFPSTYTTSAAAGAGDVVVHEYLAESQLCFRLPVQLLTLWVEQEKRQIEQLQQVGELSGVLESTRKDLLDFHMSTVSTYMQSMKYLSTYQGAPFKPSTKKKHKEVEFAPTNLHLQRMWVQNDSSSGGHFYDVITVGAFTAYALRYRHGGVRRLQTQLVAEIGEHDESVVSTLNSITSMLRKVNKQCEQLCVTAMQGDATELRTDLESLSCITQLLIEYCDAPIVNQTVSEHSHARSSRSNTPLSSPAEPTLKWSGTDFVMSPTEEPWEMTRLNTQAALLCVVSMVDELVDKAAAAQWLQQLSPLIIKLRSCLQVMCQRATLALTVRAVTDTQGHVPLLHSLKYRRDVCFSQAMTAAATAITTQLHCRLHDSTYLHQLLHVGLLLQFEGLLSCYTAEMGMIEDMDVAIALLAAVNIKLVEMTSDSSELPWITSDNVVCEVFYPELCRTGYVLNIPLLAHHFDLLPAELKLGRPIRLTPVYFNVGINEQATLAEKIGDLSVQAEVNVKNFKMLHDYYRAYVDFVSDQPADLEHVMRLLHVEVMSKKPKNVELLHYAAAVCRMMNGARFTSCKSGKDRTAMSVTLEQIQLLLAEHSLSRQLYLAALDCLRSEGLRRDNTSKNTGCRKYAFNSLQLMSMPRLYRPPSGTYGNIQT